MGHAIEEIALQRGHNIVLKISSANREEMTAGRLKTADVAIEFSTPACAHDNVMQCMAAGINVVSGTTGWNEHLPEAESYATANDAGLLHASNFSVGVNIFFEVNKKLAALMDGRKDYFITIEETHHTLKKDAPSGTAITLAEQILHNLHHKNGWALNDFNERESIPVIAHRVENVPGTHKISYSSAIDDIDIVHTAHNRTGFALGAVLAAEFIAGKKGVFSMSDVLGIN